MYYKLQIWDKQIIVTSTSEVYGTAKYASDEKHHTKDNHILLQK